MIASKPLSFYFPRLKPDQQKALAKLGIHSVEDLLYHFPARYENTGPTGTIKGASPGSVVTLYGTIRKPEAKKSWKTRKPMAEAWLEDASGRIKLRWFSQPYIAKMLADGMVVKATGKITGSEKSLYLANPEIDKNVGAQDVLTTLFAEGTGGDNTLYPIYPESKGVSSLWFTHAMKRLFEAREHEALVDPIPAEILKRYNLPTLSSALVFMHAPKKKSDAEAAKKRFAFQEVFSIQLASQIEKRSAEHEEAEVVQVNREALADFVSSFPFPPTQAQKKAIEHIVSDFEKRHPMRRLLEGDVGSGKTAVAAATSYLVATSTPKGRRAGNLQVAYMCPTEILAKQHFSTFVSYFKDHPIPIGLITGSECRKFPSKISYEESAKISRTQFSKWVANGEIPIVIGTHALVYKSLEFKNLAYAIIDEQHRFGKVHRQKLARKGSLEGAQKLSDARRGKTTSVGVHGSTTERGGGTRNKADEDFVRLPSPHLLTMTATPIPRTLALTIYGDLDLSLLDQMPLGRKPIITEVLAPAGREKAYERVREELGRGRQAYVICPRIDEPDPAKELALQARSVKAEAARLKKEVFPATSIDILHSKMTPADKEKVMKKFEQGEVDILVATSVVEVGVNVPNATVILIEGAERFGLSQLHQLRGRVIRSTHQAYCFVLPESWSGTTRDRLKALTKAKDGFELAEYDLTLRGAGELTGARQWGLSDIAMEAIQNIKMVEAAREEAKRVVESDPALAKHPSLARLAARAHEAVHPE